MREASASALASMSEREPVALAMLNHRVERARREQNAIASAAARSHKADHDALAKAQLGERKHLRHVERSRIQAAKQKTELPHRITHHYESERRLRAMGKHESADRARSKGQPLEKRFWAEMFGGSDGIKEQARIRRANLRDKHEHCIYGGISANLSPFNFVPYGLTSSRSHARTSA